jgi:hypothetical protein
MNLQTRLLDWTMIALAVVCGLGSIALLVVAGPAGYTDFGWSEPAVLGWDVLLSLLFFAQHSGMVRRSFRSRLASVAPMHYQGAIYTIASGITFAAVVICWQKSLTQLFVLEGALLWTARLLSASAVAIFALSGYSLRSFDPLGIGPIRAHLSGRTHVPGPFVVRGPYRWVRHPLYSCILVLFWTNPDWTTDRLLFNVLWTAWIYLGTIFEERDLTREFGDLYTEYQQRVPMLIPWRRPVASSG